ncbi:MAG: hypothetical protein LBR07_00320 [Puniceicoccales bacterium]|jgi:hypothetical protein|nr:hypothetical protein [Puniceicoccales bacterium]
MLPQPPSENPFAQSAPSLLAITDCLTGATERVASLPRLIHEINPLGRAVAIEFQTGPDDSVVLAPATGIVADSVLINGSPLDAAVALAPGEIFSLSIGRRLLLVQAGAPADWPPAFDPALWQIFDSETGDLLGEIPPREIPATAASQGWDLGSCATCPRGLDTGFHLAGVADILASPDTTGAGFGASAAGGLMPAFDSSRGKFLCPACWLRFDAGDALSIAAHENLRGDPVLGPDAMLRFYPTHFNDCGQAVDPMGLAAVELACPHCRRQLPPGFLDMPHKIFSLIGAPGSGKSYFLAVLVQRLQERIHNDFHLVFKDADPTGNMLLNQMRARLFSGTTPEECVLAKTAMEGATYERLPRLGKWVALPRPFVYALAETADGGAATGVVLYDNAGEHFEPGHNMDDSPGALHVVSSSGIFFLYDPTSNPRFRRELAGSDDPQLHQFRRADQQDSILAEMEVRVKKKLGLAPSEKIPVPIALLIGKCDVWTRLLDARQLPDPVRDGALDTATVDANSARLRALMDALCPGLVAHAESLSDNVRYFAVSSLGHSPRPVEEGPNAGLLAPDPEKIAPIGIEAPAYWLLSRAAPNLIPAH